MARILIAEDNSILRNMYKTQLKKAGFEVELAANGEEAIVIMDAKPVDVLLLDLLTPKVNGFGVMEHVRKRKYAFPIIVLTNLDERLDRKKCEELGATAFLIKSDTDIPHIIEKIRGVLPRG